MCKNSYLLFHLSRKFRLCITKASGKAHPPKDVRACPKALSGRELSAKLTEGECVTIKLDLISKSRRLLRHAPQRNPKAHFIRFDEPLPRATFLS